MLLSLLHVELEPRLHAGLEPRLNAGLEPRQALLFRLEWGRESPGTGLGFE